MMSSTARAILFRLIYSLILLTSLLTAVFFLIRLIPGGPFDSERVISPEIEAQLNAIYGLDAPIFVQYLNWLKSLLRGDLGVSFQQTDYSIRHLISLTLPVSVSLGTVALAVSMTLAIPIGLLSAYSLEKQKWTGVDQALRILVLLSSSTPGFLLASGLIWIFSIQLGWLPPGLWGGFLDKPEYWVLPVMTLALRPLALIARQIRGSTREVLSQDFIRTARSKGLSETAVLVRHALRNAWIPVIGLFPPIAAHLLTGSFLVETIFQIPGLGKNFIGAILNRDYALIMGTTLVFGVFLSFFNFIGDVLLIWADPRVRFKELSQ